MTYTTTDLEQFSVVGIAVKTTNQNGQAQKDISELWQKFFSNNISNRVPNKVSDDIYCVYTDYESDVNGAYTTILGYKVTTLESVPEGLIGKSIPKATYQLYRSKGELPQSVLATWGHIWQTLIKRRYLADFDVYGQQSQDPSYAEVETYLSVQ